MPVVVNSVYNANHINAGKMAGIEQRSVVDAGIYSHCGGAGAVPVMVFGEKLQLYSESILSILYIHIKSILKVSFAPASK